MTGWGDRYMIDINDKTQSFSQYLRICIREPNPYTEFILIPKSADLLVWSNERLQQWLSRELGLRREQLPRPDSGFHGALLALDESSRSELASALQLASGSRARQQLDRRLAQLAAAAAAAVSTPDSG